ncbi:hypothetical protein GCM10010124_04090 [Pilimelia terevasa]|uniref:Uncharacterized protein n=1 Tax=Pilimelia terevasa TaxID=53372 RepID=A0A8J3BEY2_9ACTN|nr:hypothetical protein [Pilimelia terevasa]GGK14695.1 hypothetical protein GCM10010124_04090 [Pilimelia terevasa]
MTTPHSPSPGPFDAATDSAPIPAQWRGTPAPPPPAASPEAPHVPAQRAPAADPPQAPAPVPTYPPPGLPAADPAPAAKPRGPFFKIMLLIAVAAVALAGAVGWQVARHLTYEPSARAAIGECLDGGEPKHMRKVGCTEPGARWRVLGRIDQITERQFQASNVCAAFPTAEFTFWEAAARKDAKGYALCLGPATP